MTTDELKTELRRIIEARQFSFEDVTRTLAGIARDITSEGQLREQRIEPLYSGDNVTLINVLPRHFAHDAAVLFACADKLKS